MRLYKNIIRKCIGRLSAIAALASVLSLQSCDMIKDESDCYQSYNLVRLVYDHNMKFADAFDSEVKAVTLLAFNSETGRLVKRIDAPHSALNDDNELVLDVAPGKYDIIVWGGEHPKSFAIATGTEGESQIQDFHCRMNRLDEQGTAHVREDLAPPLARTDRRGAPLRFPLETQPYHGAPKEGYQHIPRGAPAHLR